MSRDCSCGTYCEHGFEERNSILAVAARDNAALARIQALMWNDATRDVVSGRVSPPTLKTHVRVRDILAALNGGAMDRFDDALGGHDCTWFRENSAAQAALGRVRELVAEWENAAEGGHPRNYAASLFGTAARDLRRALGDMPLASAAGVVAESCTACDYGYPASACSSSCDCGACR